MSKSICYGWIAMLDYYSWLEISTWEHLRPLSNHNNLLEYGGIYYQEKQGWRIFLYIKHMVEAANE